jgi:hypothetical protein
MRTPWPVFVLELFLVAAAVVLVGLGFGWGVAAGLVAILAAVLAVGLLAGRRFARSP